MDKIPAGFRKTALAVLSGLMLTGAFPKTTQPWMAWIALVPMLFALRGLSSFNSFRIGFLTGLVHYLSLLYWLVATMHTYGRLPLYLCVSLLFLLAAYLAIYPALFSLIINGLQTRQRVLPVLIPIFWVGLEYIRAHLFSGFPWGLLGYSQSEVLPVIQIADITGVYGISFLIAFSNAAFFLICLYFFRKDWQGIRPSGFACTGAAAALLLVAGIVGSYGAWRLNTTNALSEKAPSRRLAVIQGNISQSEKWNKAFQDATTRKYLDLSLAAKTDQPDLIVWPETAAPFYFTHDTRLTQLVQSGIQQAGAYFLIGSPSFIRRDGLIDYMNSAYLISPEGKTRGKYDKVHLVPFGEYVPLKQFLPFVGKIVAEVGDFAAGPEGHTLTWEDHPIGIQICFEIIFPQLSRAMAANHAALLVNITNDAWFDHSSGPYQHFAMTVFRAVENRRALVRSANTGISGFIAPSGKVMAATPLFEDKIMTSNIPLMQIPTFYTRYGDLFVQICLTAAILIILRHARKKYFQRIRLNSTH